MKTQFSLSDRFCRMACSIILLTKRQSIHCMIVITLNNCFALQLWNICNL